MGSTSGSPLQARLEVNVFMVILILIAIIVVVAFIYVISRLITNYTNSPEYIEKKKNRPTSHKDGGCRCRNVPRLRSRGRGSP